MDKQKKKPSKEELEERAKRKAYKQKLKELREHDISEYGYSDLGGYEKYD